jgi:hypothetical protein
MATPITRQSTYLNLEDRYQKSSVGGSFNAKSAGQTFTDFMPNTFADGFTKGSQNTSFPKKDSIFLQGHSNQKYTS